MDTRVIASKYAQNDTDINGVSMFSEVKRRILQSAGKLPFHDEVSIRCFYSLGTYDLVIFLSSHNPELSSEALMYITTSMPEISISSSFYIFNYSKNDLKSFQAAIGKTKDVPTGDNTSNLSHLSNIRFGMRIRAVRRKFVDVHIFRETLSELLNIDDNVDVIGGHVTGDEDIVFSISMVSCLRFLLLFHPDINNQHNLFRVSNEKYGQSWVANRLRRLNSTPAYFSGNFASKLEKPIYVGLDSTEKDYRFHQMEKSYNQAKERYDMLREHSVIALPKVVDFPIRSILEKCRNLLRIGSHQITAYNVLSLLKLGYDQYEECANSGTERADNAREAIINLATNLSSALDNIVSSSNLGISRLSELYSANSHSKLLSSYRNIVKDIYNCLPLFLHNKNEFVDIIPFLNIGETAFIKSVYYFRMQEGDSAQKRILSLDMPSPTFLDLHESYCYILHEIAHRQYHKGNVRINETLRDIVFSYVTLFVLRNCQHKSMSYTFSHVFTLINNVSAIRRFNESYSDLLPGEITFSDYTGKLIKALQDAISDLSLHEKGLECELYISLKMLTNGNSLALPEIFYYVYNEARADVLMIEMIGEKFGIEQYFDFWSKHYTNYTKYPLSKKGGEIYSYKFCFILAYFMRNKNTPITSQKLEDYSKKWPCFTKAFELFPKAKLITLPFTEHVKCWYNVDDGEESMFDKLNIKWNLKGISPLDMPLIEQVKFHINHWFCDVISTEKSILDSK